MASISFPSLCVFTGLATSENALQSARQSLVNMKSKNSYIKEMNKYLDQFDDGTYKTIKDETFYKRIWKAIAKSFNEVFATVENGCCAIFRKQPKIDVFFKGQEMYGLTDSCAYVLVKKYGVAVWEKKE